MSAATGTVWIGLRADGIEILRVKATCAEVSRSNGIAKFKVLGVVLFPEMPCDARHPVLTVSETEHSHPFCAAPLEWQTLSAGQNYSMDRIDFEQILEVPRYVAPPKERKRSRLRLSR